MEKDNQITPKVQSSLFTDHTGLMQPLLGIWVPHESSCIKSCDNLYDEK